MLITIPLTGPTYALTGPTDAPPHPDPDGEWVYVVIDGEGQTIFADNLGELVNLVIEGYSDIPEGDDGNDKALVARYEALVEMAERAQRYLLDEAVESGLFDPLDAGGEDVLTALVAPRVRPWSGTDDGSTNWQGQVPLVLIATDYEPYTDRIMPTGKVVMLNPATELTFMESMNKLGLLRLFRSVR